MNNGSSDSTLRRQKKRPKFVKLSKLLRELHGPHNYYGNTNYDVGNIEGVHSNIVTTTQTKRKRLVRPFRSRDLQETNGAQTVSSVRCQHKSNNPEAEAKGTALMEAREAAIKAREMEVPNLIDEEEEEEEEVVNKEKIELCYINQNPGDISIISSENKFMRGY